MFSKIGALAGVVLTCTFGAIPGAASAAAQIGPTTGTSICCTTSGSVGGYVGQSFKVPVGESALSSMSINVGSANTPASVPFVLELRTYSGGVLGGTALATSGPLSTTVSPFGGQGQTFTFAPPGGVPVTALADYAIIARRTGGAGEIYAPLINTSVYADGIALGSTGNYTQFDSFFQVNFVAAPATVPTMSEWAMILFGIMLAGGAAIYIQRRRLAV